MARIQKLLTMALLLSPTLLRGVPVQQDEQQPKEKSMLDRIMHFYAWNDPKAPKFKDQTKQFTTKQPYADKTFSTSDYNGTKAAASKDYNNIKSYSDTEKTSWLSKLFPSKKLPENLQETAQDSSKQFETGKFATKEFASSDKADPYKGKETFETKQVSLKGKTQGALDNNVKLQEAVKKGLSIDDVRKLLEKGP